MFVVAVVAPVVVVLVFSLPLSLLLSLPQRLVLKPKLQQQHRLLPQSE